MKVSSAAAADIARALESRQIRQVKVGGFDIHGVFRSYYASLDRFQAALLRGIGGIHFTGLEDADIPPHAMLDPTTLRFPPWEPGTAVMLADFRDPSGAPHPGCPRSLLRLISERSRAMGFTTKFAFQIEFWVFPDVSFPASKNADLAFGHEPTAPLWTRPPARAGQHPAFIRSLMEDMRIFDVEVEGVFGETDSGIWRASLAADDACRTADKVALFKASLQHIARAHGLTPTFMARWSAAQPATWVSIRQNLLRGETNGFFDANASGGVSAVLRHYLGGQLALMPDLTAIHAPYINSYKRSLLGKDPRGAMYPTWGVEANHAIRLLDLQVPQGAKLDFRQATSDMNPYLSVAACLGAGLYGIQRQLEPPPAGSALPNTSGDRPLVPRTLSEATERMQQSQVACEILGERFLETLVSSRQRELQEYNRAVTDWELGRYFRPH